MLQALKELGAHHQAAAQRPEQDPAAFAELTAVLHGALQRRLQDDDCSVLHAVLQLPSLLGLPGAVLLQALRHLLQRCLTVLSKQQGEVDDQYRAETCSVAKRVGAFRVAWGLLRGMRKELQVSACILVLSAWLHRISTEHQDVSPAAALQTACSCLSACYGSYVTCCFAVYRFCCCCQRASSVPIPT